MHSEHVPCTSLKLWDLLSYFLDLAGDQNEKRDKLQSPMVPHENLACRNPSSCWTGLDKIHISTRFEVQEWIIPRCFMCWKPDYNSCLASLFISMLAIPWGVKRALVTYIRSCTSDVQLLSVFILRKLKYFRYYALCSPTERAWLLWTWSARLPRVPEMQFIWLLAKQITFILVLPGL